MVAALLIAPSCGGVPAAHSTRHGPVGIAGAVRITRSAGSALINFDFDQTYASTTHALRFTGSFNLATLTGRAETEEVVPVPQGRGQSASTAGPSAQVGPASTTSTPGNQQPRAFLYHGATVLTAHDYYVSLPATILGQTGGRQWADIPLSSLGQLVQDAGLNTLQATILDPRFWWDILGSTGNQARFVETAVVDGTSTRVYHATSDLLVAASSAGPLLPVLDQTISALGTARLPVQVAIDTDGYVRQASFSMVFPLGNPGAPPGSTGSPNPTGSSSPTGLSTFQLDAVITFVSFGIPVNVSVPSADQTVNFSSVMPTLMGRTQTSTTQSTG